MKSLCPQLKLPLNHLTEVSSKINSLLNCACCTNSISPLGSISLISDYFSYQRQFFNSIHHCGTFLFCWQVMNYEEPAKSEDKFINLWKSWELLIYKHITNLVWKHSKAMKSSSIWLGACSVRAGQVSRAAQPQEKAENGGCNLWVLPMLRQPEGCWLN